MKAAGILSLLAIVAGCASLSPPADEPEQVQAPAAPDISATPWSIASSPVSPEPWQHWNLPGKRATEFSYAFKDGRDVMAVKAKSSASMLRHAVRIEPADLGNVRFSWKVPELIRKADMAVRDADDSPVRIVLAFEGDRSTFSPKNAVLSELARALTGEPMPYATLMYVWCNRRDPGSVITNPRTDRVRKMVVESGARNLGQWLDYERDIRADFIKAYGEEPGALVGIGIMTDTDNTKSTTTAWYGPVKLAPVSTLPAR